MSDGFADRPVLHAFEIEVWNAFARLSMRRSVGGFGAVSAISYTEIAAFLDIILQLDDPEDRAEFIALIEHLDGLFLAEFAEKQKQSSPGAQKKRPTPPSLNFPDHP